MPKLLEMRSSYLEWSYLLAPFAMIVAMVMFWPNNSERVWAIYLFGNVAVIGLLRKYLPIFSQSFLSFFYYLFLGVGALMALDPLLRLFGLGTLDVLSYFAARLSFH